MCAFFAKLLNVPTEPPTKNFKDPVFLIGLMRSGTTLLMNTLSAHPQLLKAGFELNNMWTEIGGAPCSEKCELRLASDLQAKYQNNVTAYFERYIQNSKSLLRHLSRWSQKKYYGSGRVFYDWDNLFLMNKSPHLSNKISYINAMYPNAKFVVIVRSPFGQAASQKMHFLDNYKKRGIRFYLPDDRYSCWGKVAESKISKFSSERLFPENFSLIPEAWLRLNTIIFNQLKEVDESRKVVFAYEDFVLNRGECLKSVFQMLQLKEKYKKFERKIIRNNKHVKNTTTEGDPLRKWKRYLTSEEKDQALKFLFKHSEEYNKITNHVNNSKLLWNISLET